MLRMISVLFIMLLMVAAGCSGTSDGLYDVQQGSSGDAVFVSIKQNGISADASEVVINNFRPGARAEIIYRIHNGTAAAIRPEIYLVDADVTSYSQADGAVKAPVKAAEWLMIPRLDDIPPGEIKEYTVAIEIPKNVSGIPDKFGFQVQVAGNTGGTVQTAVGTWWLVTMR